MRIDHLHVRQTALKLLLTSAGVTNASIGDALVELPGKPIAESTEPCIPTAQYGHPMVGPGVMAWQLISCPSPNPIARINEPDMQTRRGAPIMRQILSDPGVRA